MSYLDIDNLYKFPAMYNFRRVYALEKIHGTSAHIAFNADTPGGKEQVTFFSGGCKFETFKALFNREALLAAFESVCLVFPRLIIYGEAYGGKCQGMSKTYGPNLRFVAFDVKVRNAAGREYWLAVPDAEQLAFVTFGLEFVPYTESDMTQEAVDVERDKISFQGERNGMEPMPREGIVLRPLVELTMNNGARIIAKHKGENFQERVKQPRDPNEITVLTEANKIADEWVTPMRLTHVLDALREGVEHLTIQDCSIVAKAMVVDVLTEGLSEIEDSRVARKAIAHKAIELYKEWLKNHVE